MNLNCIVTALLLTVTISLPFGPAGAVDSERLDQLFARLAVADRGEAHRIAGEIELEFSKSGSASMDLLLKRGRDAFEAGQIEAAISHLTALTDHAPDFAEGFYWRALAYVRRDLYGPAFSDLERALTLAPRHYEAIGVLGFLLEEMDRPDMAHEAYSRAVALHPHHEDLKAALERLKPQLNGSDL